MTRSNAIGNESLNLYFEPKTSNPMKQGHVSFQINSIIRTILNNVDTNWSFSGQGFAQISLWMRVSTEGHKN